MSHSIIQPPLEGGSGCHHRDHHHGDNGESGRDRDTILGVNVTVGDIIAVVIRGDGQNGVFVGRVASINDRTVRLSLVTSSGPISSGSIIAIDRNQIAAVARPATSPITGF